MRAFVALPLPPPQRTAAAALRDELRKTRLRASWVRTENLHVTLRFLGDCEEEQAAVLTERLREICARQTPIPLVPRGAGAFPNVRKPSVLWAGLESETAGPLVALQGEIEAAARAVGFARETKPFHPHVTLARVKPRQDTRVLREALEANAAFEGGAFEATGIVLYQSQLCPGGAVYTPLAEFPLGLPGIDFSRGSGG